MTGPEKRGQQQDSWLASDSKTNSLSAPSTPWHREVGCGDEDHSRQQNAADKFLPQEATHTAHAPSHQPNVVSDSQAQGIAREPHMHGPHSTHNCTVCGSGHHFKTPATQDITAVACEMMTLVSMRTAMSEVLGNLVHKWRDVMPSSLELPIMHGEAGAQHSAPKSGECMQAGEHAAEWKIPASVEATKYANGGVVELQRGQDATAASCPSSNAMLLRHQPCPLATMPTEACPHGQAAPHAAEHPGSEAISQPVVAVERPTDAAILGRDTSTAPAVGIVCGAPDAAVKGTTRRRHRRREAKPAQPSEPGRDDSMSGPFKVTFAPSVVANRERRSKKKSSTRSRSSHKQHADKKGLAAAATIPEHQSTAEPIHQQLDESIASQDFYSTSGLDWTESAVSVATDADTGCAPVVPDQPTTLLQTSNSTAPEVEDLALEDPQEGGKVAGGTELCLSQQSAQPVLSQGSRSESFWPLSDDDTVPVMEDSSRNGAGQTPADEGDAAAVVSESSASIATGTHGTAQPSCGHRSKVSCCPLYILSLDKETIAGTCTLNQYAEFCMRLCMFFPPCRPFSQLPFPNLTWLQHGDTEVKLGSEGKENSSERSQAPGSVRSNPSTRYSSSFVVRSLCLRDTLLSFSGASLHITCQTDPCAISCIPRKS